MKEFNIWNNDGIKRTTKIRHDCAEEFDPSIIYKCPYCNGIMYVWDNNTARNYVKMACNTPGCYNCVDDEDSIKLRRKTTFNANFINTVGNISRKYQPCHPKVVGQRFPGILDLTKLPLPPIKYNPF